MILKFEWSPLDLEFVLLRIGNPELINIASRFSDGHSTCIKVKITNKKISTIHIYNFSIGSFLDWI
jgi:hypothetical protein